MQALVFTEPGRVVLRDEPVPQPSVGEALITVEASGICGSELHGFRAVGMRNPPMIMGHEFAGTTADGARVVVNPLVTCGFCIACESGRESICEVRELLGVHRPGGFAEYAVVPADSLHALPEGVSWAAAALIEPLANAVHAWRLAETDGSPVAIVGAGSIGLVCLLVALQHNDGPVVVADPSPERRAVAQQLGGTVVASLEQASTTFGTTFDAVGLPATRAAALAQLRRGGTSVWLGLATADAGFDGNHLVRAEQRILGSFAYTPDDFSEAVKLAEILDLSWTTEVPMSDAESTFMELAAGRTDIIKAVLRR